MIRFDANSIYDKLLGNLQQDPNWKAIANNSVISSILNSNAEVTSEIARYAEYLFKESKWDTAQNPSSILAMANMLGYRPARKISAVGEIIVSLEPRIHLVENIVHGITFDDNPQVYAEETARLALSNWARPINKRIEITSNMKVINEGRNINFIPIEDVLENNAFYKKIRVIQGTLESIQIDMETIRDISVVSSLDPYISIPVVIKDCEDANNPLSKSYFKVFLLRKSTNSEKAIEKEEYRVVDTLLFSSADDRDVEVINDLYSRDLFYLKFNRDPTRGISLDITRDSNILGIEIQYIKSAGKKGNLLNNYEKFTLTSKDENGAITKLYGINIKGITGGKDEETIKEIKYKAPKYYMKNYTAGTKEAYENTILNLLIRVEEDNTLYDFIPTKVQVYADNSSKRSTSGKVTCVSFIAPGLDDYLEAKTVGTLNTNASSDTKNAIDKISEALDTNLMNLKSPQDIIEFRPPNYITFAVNVTAAVKPESSKSLIQLNNDISEYVNDLWGSNSDRLNFGRSFFSTILSADINDKFRDYLNGSSVTVEAIQKLNWMNSKLIMSSNVNKEEIAKNSVLAGSIKATASPDIDSSYQLHTIRVPFSFNKVFNRGFFHKNKGTIRIDIMYSNPKTVSPKDNFDISIFIADPRGSIEDSKSFDEIGIQRSFYVKQDKGSVWSPNIGTDEKFSEGNYSELVAVDPKDIGSETYQYRLSAVKGSIPKEDLKNLGVSGLDIATGLEASDSELGSITDYLIYFKSDYENIDDDQESIAGGWIEFGFDSFYNILSTFSFYDENLRNRLEECPKSTLKCGLDQSTAFTKFKTILRDYVDIYVSMLPVSSDIILAKAQGNIGKNKVLEIDSFDSKASESVSNVSKVRNLSATKKSRMITVKSIYKEN